MLKRLVLCDQSLEVVNAWKAVFAKESGVRVLQGDILRSGCQGIVSPGRADGGSTAARLPGAVLRVHVATIFLRSLRPSGTGLRR